VVSLLYKSEAFSIQTSPNSDSTVAPLYKTRDLPIVLLQTENH